MSNYGLVYLNRFEKQEKEELQYLKEAGANRMFVHKDILDHALRTMALVVRLLYPLYGVDIVFSN